MFIKFLKHYVAVFVLMVCPRISQFRFTLISGVYHLDRLKLHHRLTDRQKKIHDNGNRDKRYDRGKPYTNPS